MNKWCVSPRLFRPASGGGGVNGSLATQKRKGLGHMREPTTWRSELDHTTKWRVIGYGLKSETNVVRNARKDEYVLAGPKCGGGNWNFRPDRS